MAAATAMPRTSTLAELVSQFAPGERVFLPGSAGEIPALTEALFSLGAPPLDITASFVPGINRIALERLPRGATFTSMFAQPTIPRAQAEGRFRHLPLSYGGFAGYLRDHASFDTCIVHVAPPDAEGRCSLGIAVEFAPIAAARSRRIVAIANPQMPNLPGADFIRLEDVGLVVENDAPLCTYDVGPASAQASLIASHVAAFIGDGAALQVGLGKVPDALLRQLTGRRGLRLHSGMLSDGARALAEAGSLDPRWLHTSCVHVGTADYYAWLADRADFAVRACDHTHSAALLAGLPRLMAVNSALSIDLFGQANLDMLDGRMVSGVGGAADFSRGASLSPGGASMIALPATSGNGLVSRIVPVLEGPCSIPRHDVDIIVTQFGAADLRGCSVVERGQKIIAIAAPRHQAALQDAWRTMAARL